MEKGIYRFILRHSLRDQITLVIMSAAALPFLYVTLELPKIIVNEAIGGRDFPKTVLGMEFGQVPFLLLLCGLFLILVVISGVLKYFTSTYRYRVGDRLLNVLRYDLIERVMRFPSAAFRNLSSGQIVSMITAETSNLGFFIAEAFAVPVIALGTLATVVLFMFMQNWAMGVAAIALYPLQIYIIPKLQKQINALQRQEVQAQRGVAQRIGDVVQGVNEIHGHDTTQFELAGFAERLKEIFNYRMKISSKRYLTNVLNQFFSQLTPFFFLSIGGYQVIVGEISLGALVAVLAAYKEMYAPWKDLIDYYQKAEDARVRFDQLNDVFARPDLLEKAILETEPSPRPLSELSLVAENVVVEKDEGVRAVDGATVHLQLPAHTVVLGSGASGREEFARLLARQESPHAGSLRLGESNLSELPDSVTGRRIAFVSSATYLGSGTLRETLLYPLCRGENGSGSAHPVDFAAAGCADAAALERRIMEILRIVNLDEDIYQIGLRQRISPDEHPELTARLIEARGRFLHYLQSENRATLIESFDPDAYLSHATVAENILFGSPIGPDFSTRNLAGNSYVLEVLEQTGLRQPFLEMGRKLAALKAEMFRELPPGHEFIERFSFIRSEELPHYEAILRCIDTQGMDALDDSARERLMALPFRLIDAQHHVDLIDEKLKERLLAARRAFAAGLPEDLRGAIRFFDRNAYDTANTIMENIVFGKPASSLAGASEQVNIAVSGVVNQLGLRDEITGIGLEWSIGVGGTRLTNTQKQKLAIARSVLKRPDIIILSDAFSSLDFEEQKQILRKLKREFEGRSVILFESNDSHRHEFEEVLVMEQGKIVPHGQSTGEAPTGLQAESEDGTGAAARSADINSIVAMLSDIPLFKGIERSRLKLLAFASELTHFEQGQIVFHQGDAGDSAYLVIEGEADVLLELENGVKNVATLGRNEIFGELALLSNIPRSTTIRAATPLVLLSLSQDVLLRMIEENGDVALSMVRVLAQRLTTTLQDYGAAVSAGGEA